LLVRADKVVGGNVALSVSSGKLARESPCAHAQGYEWNHESNQAASKLGPYTVSTYPKRGDSGYFTATASLDSTNR